MTFSLSCTLCAVPENVSTLTLSTEVLNMVNITTTRFIFYYTGDEVHGPLSS